jgi:glutamate 5-kinase
LVSSGAIATGRHSLGINEKPSTLSQKQALAAVGQARLIMEYRKLFSEYNLRIAQILMTKSTITEDTYRDNAKATFTQLLAYGAVPIVNENDTISTYEIQFGDNDRLSALVSALVEADLLILLSDIDGLYTDDPNTNKNAEFINFVEDVDKYMDMGKSTSKSGLGTGGMYTKLLAAQIATNSGCDMVIASAEDMSIIENIANGEEIGTYFPAKSNKDFDWLNCLE